MFLRSIDELIAKSLWKVVFLPFYEFLYIFNARLTANMIRKLHFAC